LIERPTVFILGAGASCPYGFPSGRKLIFKIVEGVRHRLVGQRTRGETMWMGFDIDDVSRCAEELLASAMPSVDLFLENRPEFEAIGKALIAAELIPCENPSRLRRNWERTEWLEYLYGKMVSTATAFPQNQITFISFNYDRLIEHFFFTSLKSSFCLSDEDTHSLLGHIPIVHVHGQLGVLGSGADSRPFDTQVTEATLKTAAAGIKVIHEVGDTPTAEYTRAHQLLGQAEIVCFLGFGYQEDNVRRLRAGTIRSYQVFAGTGFGLEAAERTQSAQLVGGNIAIDDPSRDCVLFLRNQDIF